MNRNADELPPCFTSESFSKRAANKIGQFKLSRDDGFGTIQLSTTRFSLAPRELEVLHPIAFARLARHLKSNWSEWSQILTNNRSAIRVGPHEDGRIFSMTARAESSELDYPSGRFLAKVDITTFYRSIYTHSLPWAIDGVRAAKESKGSSQGWADGLDKLLQASRRGETSGIPIGPGTSAVVGEILLGQVDQKLSASLADFNYLRFVDDYYCVTSGRDDAETFIQTVRTMLLELRLNVHPLKTEIVELPYPNTPTWKRRLRASLGTNPRLINFLDALDDVIESAHHADEDSAMRYVLLTLEDHLFSTASESNQAGVDPIAKRLMNMAFAYPVVVGTLCRILPQTTTGNSDDTVDSLNEILVEHASKRRTDAMTWILYYLLKNGLAIHGESVDAVSMSRDCLSLALIAQSKKWEHKVGEFLQDLETRNPKDYDRDEFWLLYYHFASKGKPAVDLPESYFEELEVLRGQQVEFIDLNIEPEFSPVPSPRPPRSRRGTPPRLSPYDISIGDY